MLNVILVKYLGIMLQKVEILGKMLRRKAIMLSIKMKFDPTLLLAYKGEKKEEKNGRYLDTGICYNPIFTPRIFSDVGMQNEVTRTEPT